MMNGPDYFPLVPARKWIYSYSVWDGERVEFLLEPSKEWELEPFGTMRASRLINPFHDFLVVAPGVDGVRALRKTYVGPRGRPTITVEWEFRWAGDETWEFRYAGGGCVITKVAAHRRGRESIRVPAGSFDCLRFDFSDGKYRNDSYWIAEDMGIVRWVERDGETEDVLELITVQG